MGLKRRREDHLQGAQLRRNLRPTSRTLSSCEKPRSRAAAPNTLLAGLAQPAVLPDDDNLPDSKLPCVSGFPWVWLSFISAMKSARGMGLRSVREILEIIGLILPLTVFVLTAIVRRERLRRKACVARTWTADRKVPSGAPPSRPCSIKRKPRRMEPPGLRQPVWGIGAGDNRLTAV